MRILLATPEVPLPPINGMRLHVRHVAQELTRRRHEVHVVGYRWPDQEDDDLPGIELRSVEAPSRALPVLAKTWLRASVRGDPVAVISFTEGIQDTIVEMLSERQFDIAHITSAVMARLKPALGQLPSILAPLDAWHLNVAAAVSLGPLPTRPLRRLEARRVRRFESRVLREYARVVMITQQDAVAVRALDPTLHPDVIPNGVDTDAFAPTDTIEPEPGHLVFTGALAYPPNITAAQFLARQILPRIRLAVPGAHLSIVGRTPRPEVLELSSLEGVDVVADVPDMRPSLHRAEVFVCPMVSGTGIKNKLLEALACGRPAVATTLSCQGMAVRSGEELLIADGEDAFSGAVVRLLGDAELQGRLAAAGRRYVLEHHSWAAVATAYESVYRGAIEAAGV